MDPITAGAHVAYRTDRLAREADARRLAGASPAPPAAAPWAGRPTIRHAGAVLGAMAGFLALVLALGAINATGTAAASSGGRAGGGSAHGALLHR